LEGKIFLAKRDISIELFKLKEDGNAFIEAKFLDSGHLLRLEMEIEPESKKIVKCQAEMPNAPFQICSQTTKKAKSLIGLVIEKGVMKKIAEAVGGPCGCIHLRELASDAANFAAGVLIGYGKEGGGLLTAEFEKQPEEVRLRVTKEALQNNCLAYKEDKVVC